jgi:hypothetical protein
VDEAVRKNGGRYPVLQYCRDGRDLENETDVVCPYKDAASIKNTWHRLMKRLWRVTSLSVGASQKCAFGTYEPIKE